MHLVALTTTADTDGYYTSISAGEGKTLHCVKGDKLTSHFIRYSEPSRS